jgi:hypothetical protein
MNHAGRSAYRSHRPCFRLHLTSLDPNTLEFRRFARWNWQRIMHFRAIVVCICCASLRNDWQTLTRKAGNKMIDTVDTRCFLMNQILLGGLLLAIFDFCVAQDQSLLKSEVQHTYIVEYKKEHTGECMPTVERPGFWITATTPPPESTT